MGRSNRLLPRQVAFWAMLLVLIVATVLAWVSEEWRVTNLVIGFLFGFFLQRGSFCGASILSSVVLYKDFWGLTGVGMALFTSMVGFAGLSALGWIEPNPRQPYLILAVIGGIAFGSGMVDMIQIEAIPGQGWYQVLTAGRGVRVSIPTACRSSGPLSHEQRRAPPISPPAWHNPSAPSWKATSRRREASGAAVGACTWTLTRP